jgi:hypothetical protein
MDVDRMPAGMDFVDVLDDQVRKCDVMLVVIGVNWLTAVDRDGNQRLVQERDYVRKEVALALALEKLVIPVLVGTVNMVSESELPPTLNPLARRHAVRVSHERFRTDCDGLVQAITAARAEAAKARRASEVEKRARVRAAARGAGIRWWSAIPRPLRWLITIAASGTATVLIIMTVDPSMMAPQVAPLRTGAQQRSGIVPIRSEVVVSTEAEQIARDNERLFRRMVVKADKKALLSEIVGKIVSNKSKYEEVAVATHAPWWFIGIVHYREVDFSFLVHLH